MNIESNLSVPCLQHVWTSACRFSRVGDEQRTVRILVRLGTTEASHPSCPGESGMTRSMPSVYDVGLDSCANQLSEFQLRDALQDLDIGLHVISGK